MQQATDITHTAVQTHKHDGLNMNQPTLSKYLLHPNDIYQHLIFPSAVQL